MRKTAGEFEQWLDANGATLKVSRDGNWVAVITQGNKEYVGEDASFEVAIELAVSKFEVALLRMRENPGQHTAKQKRQAAHIAEGYVERGMDPSEAESIGWATINRMKNPKKGRFVVYEGIPSWHQRKAGARGAAAIVFDTREEAVAYIERVGKVRPEERFLLVDESRFENPSPIYLEPRLVEKLAQWHGGQWTAVYSLMSTANAGTPVTKEMIDAAITELENDKARLRGNRRQRAELNRILLDLGDAVFMASSG